MSVRVCPILGLSAVLLAAVVGAAESADVTLDLGGGVAKPNDFAGPNGLVNAPFWTARVHVRSPSAPLFLLELEIGRWSKGWESTIIDYNGASYYDRSARTDLNLGVNLMAQTPGDRIRLSIGGGLGPHFVKSEAGQTDTYPDRPEANSTWSYSNSETKLGIHALVGLEARVSRRFSLFADARYDLLKGEAQNEIKLYGGLSFDLTRAPSPPPP
ncbi:MAG: hypothetical protein ACHQNV_04095 [Vicinamibacteria bacterium]